jgi:hypothetical protein
MITQPQPAPIGNALTRIQQSEPVLDPNRPGYREAKAKQQRAKSTSATLPKPVEYYNQLYQNFKRASASQSGRAALNELATLTPKQLAQIPDLKADSDRAIQKALYSPTPAGGDYTPEERQKDARNLTPAALIKNQIKYANDLKWNRNNQGAIDAVARRNQASAKPSPIANIPKIATPQAAAPKAAAPVAPPFVNMPKPVAAASTSQYSGGFMDDQGRFRSVGGAPATAQPEPAASGMQ